MALALATLGVAAYVAAKIRPSPLVVDHERWFKSLLFARVPRAECVLYHPLGRFAERKLDPLPVDVFPEEPLPGEADLLEKLRPLSPEGRWKVLFSDPEAHLVPEALGSIYRLETRFGADASEASFKAWSHEDSRFLSAVRRRVPLRWVWVGEHEWVQPFCEITGGMLANPESVEAAILAAPAAERWVLVASQGALSALMRVIHQGPALRDRLVAVVAVNAQVVDSEDWWQAHFQHDELDTELNRGTLYASLATLTLETVDRLAEKRFPRAGGERSFSWLEVADLGAIGDKTPPEEAIRALVAYVAGWVAAQEG